MLFNRKIVDSPAAGIKTDLTSIYPRTEIYPKSMKQDPYANLMPTNLNPPNSF
jgi:hypothetical protein